MLCRLDKVGYDVGTRLLELLCYREKTLRRRTEVLDILKFIHSVAWPTMFGKTADDLQQVRQACWLWLSGVCASVWEAAGGGMKLVCNALCVVCQCPSSDPA